MLNGLRPSKTLLLRKPGNFFETIMVIGDLTAHGLLPLVKVPKVVKLNVAQYVDSVLKPYLEF